MKAGGQVMSGLQDAIEHLNTLHHETQEAMSAMARQQEILRLRQIALQPGLLGLLQTLAGGIEKAARHVEFDSRELMQLRALAETSALINSTLDLDIVLQFAMDAVLQLTGARRGYLLLRDERGELSPRIARRQPGDQEETESISRAILRQVMSSGQPLLTDNASDDPRTNRSDTAAKFGLRSILCVPLASKGLVEGVIYVDNRLREGVFGEGELNLLTAVANQIAVATENARLFASVQASLSDIAAVTELMQNVFGSIASGVITTDARDAVTACNAAAIDILNISSEQVIGQPLRALLPPLGGEFEEAMVLALIENSSHSLEAEAEISGRGRIALKLTVSPLKNAEGAIEGVALVMDDLTAAREREQSLDLLRRYLPPGMVESIHEIARLGIGGERREVTCLFIDIGGALVQSGGMTARRKMELLNQHLETITAVVHQAGGLIDKYMGSDVMTLFNTQLNPQNDHARNALECALALADAFAAYPGSYRMGVHTGVATLGNVGSLQRRSFTALGDNINLAKRLQENAEGGQILVSDATLNALGATARYLRIRELEPLQVKGRQQTTRVYEVARK
jgi:PAS domain S-box-containing protein